MNKYNWATVPPEVNWIATDEDGWAYVLLDNLN